MILVLDAIAGAIEHCSNLDLLGICHIGFHYLNQGCIHRILSGPVCLYEDFWMDILSA